MKKTLEELQQEKQREIKLDNWYDIKKRRPLFKYRKCDKCCDYFKNELMWRRFIETRPPRPRMGPDTAGMWHPAEGYYVYLCMKCIPTKKDAYEYWFGK